MILILITAFLDILGMGILIPVLPDIITAFWVAESWNPYSQGIYAIGMFLGGLAFGRLSDTYGRKNMLILTSGLNLTWYIMLYISLAHDIFPWELSLLFILFIAGRFVSGLGGAGFGIIQAYISDISKPSEKTKNMGLIGAAFGLAFLMGPAIGGLLSKWWVEYVIMGCTLAIAINFLMIIFRLPEPTKHIAEMHDNHIPFHFSREVILLLLLSFGGTLAFSSIQSGSSQFYADVFGFDSDQIGYTLSLVGLIAVIYQGGLVRFVRKYLDEKQMIRVALFLMMISLGLFAMNQSVFWLFFIIPLFPIAMGSFQPSIGSMMANKAGKEVGKVMGYNTSIVSIASIIGPFMVGTLYEKSHALPFFVSAGIAGLLFMIAMVGLKK
jgi:MFS transporter, DHA1 family, tetracycline resistance protein